MTVNLKIISLILFFVLFLTCSLKNEKRKETLTDTITQVGKEIISEKTKDNQDCIFDQETQTDEFLKGIEELKNYSWNPKTKIATIKISDEETLEIFRGGCDHFSFEAKFIVKKTITFPKDKSLIFSKLLWISKLIYNKSNYEIIKDCISKNKYSINDTNPSLIHINLLNSEVYNSFTIFYNAESTSNNTFSIEYFLN